MNVGIISSREHLKLAQIMLDSLLDTSSEFIDLYLFHLDLREDEYNILEIDPRKIKIHAIQVNLGLFDGIEVKRHFGIYSYFRLLAPYVLPADVERVLWLDTDLIIRKDLVEYYHTDLGDKCLLASPSAMNLSGGGLCKELMDKYHVDGTYVYFNAGVLLMSLTKMREYISLRDILKITYDDREFLEYIDQDVLNILYWDKCVLSSQYLYNFAPKDERIDSNINKKSLKKAYIVHYCGEQKPSQPRYRDIGFMEYWAHAKKYNYSQYVRVASVHGVYVIGRWVKRLMKLK